MKVGFQYFVPLRLVASPIPQGGRISNAANLPSESPVSTAPPSSIQAITSRYDVTNISQGEIVRVGKDLVSNGFMSELDMAVMTIKLPKFQLNQDGSVADVSPTKDDGTKRDLIAEYKSRIEFGKLHGLDNSVLQRILGTLQNVQSARSGVATYA